MSVVLGLAPAEGVIDVTALPVTPSGTIVGTASGPVVGASLADQATGVIVGEGALFVGIGGTTNTTEGVIVGNVSSVSVGPTEALPAGIIVGVGPQGTGGGGIGTLPESVLQGVNVITGDEERPDALVVFWFNAETEPANFGANDYRVTGTFVPPSDTEPPATPTDLASTLITQTGFTLSWAVPIDNVGVTQYQVRQDSVTIASPTTESHAVSGLTPSTSYAYAVRARDAEGNWSGWSVDHVVETLAPDPGSEYVSIFGSAPMPGTWSNGTDGNESLWLAHRFYHTDTSPSTRTVRGARLWLPSGLPASFYSESITFYCARFDWDGVAAAAIPSDWSGALTKVVSGPHTPGAWVEAVFDTSVDIAKIDPATSGLDMVAIGYKYQYGNNYIHQINDSFEAATSGTTDALPSQDDPNLFLAERSFARSANSVSNPSAGNVYAIDILVDPVA